MALYSHQYKLLFYHIYKTGGMSVRTAMHTIDKGCINLIRGHADANDVYEYFIHNDLEELYGMIQRFTIVRNPYDWVYSIYNFALTVKSHPFHAFCLANDFDAFIKWYIECTPLFNASADLNGKIQTQSDYVYIGDELHAQTVLKFENLTSDFTDMITRLRIPYHSSLPHINKTSYAEKQVDYTELIKPVTLNIFNDYFHNDFINFKYQKL